MKSLSAAIIVTAGVALACSSQFCAASIMALTTEEGIEILFGDLSRPADILLAEAEAKVAKAALGRRLTVYMSIQRHLSERRAFNVDELKTEPGTKLDNKDNAAAIEQFERGLKQTESEIRELSAKLTSNWLPPVQTSMDDQQGANLLQRANVLVTIRSKAGDILEPTKLTLIAPGVSPVGFVQFRSGVYLAVDVSPGEYQLVWQLTPKSIVQRISKIAVGEQGCLACEVVLRLPKPRCTTKTVDAIVLPHRSTTGQGYNISGAAPSISIALPYGPQPSYDASHNDAPPNDAPPATVEEHDVTTSESDAANGLMNGESRFFNRKGKLLGTSTLVQGTGTYRIRDRNKDEPVLMKEVEYVDGMERPKP